MPSSVSINEKLRSDYYGGYVGFDINKDLCWGSSVTLSGQAGLYYADTDYEGRYYASESGFGGSGSGPISQNMSLNDKAAAVIGGLNVGLKKNFGKTEVGLFAEAEWYSHVPRIVHNDTDYAVFSVLGANDHTHLDGGSAFVYTFGPKVVVPLN